MPDGSNRIITLTDSFATYDTEYHFIIGLTLLLICINFTYRQYHKGIDLLLQYPYLDMLYYNTLRVSAFNIIGLGVN